MIFPSASHYHAIEYYIIKFPKTTLGQSVLYPGGMRGGTGTWERKSGEIKSGGKNLPPYYTAQLVVQVVHYYF